MRISQRAEVKVPRIIRATGIRRGDDRTQAGRHGLWGEEEAGQE